MVFNKADLVGRPPEITRDSADRPSSATVSARTGAGVAELKRAIAELAVPPAHRYEARIPADAARLRALAYASGRVVREEYCCGEGWRLELCLADGAAGHLRKRASRLGCALALSPLPPARRFSRHSPGGSDRMTRHSCATAQAAPMME